MSNYFADIPAGFTDDFLAWFRERTEATWATYRSQTLDDYIAAGAGGTDWQQGTRWTGGLTEEQIAMIEQRWHLRIPPDYRLFLRRLHAVDRPRRGARYTDPYNHPDEAGAPSHLVPHEAPSFRNWLVDSQPIQSALNWLWEGLAFDIEHNQLWRPSWGPLPATLSAQKARVRELVAQAPRMIPVYAHRYLLAEPCQADNPVFSIYQSDVVVYGPDLRAYLLAEFAGLLGLDERETQRAATHGQQRREAFYNAIPFWGDLYAHNNMPPGADV